MAHVGQSRPDCGLDFKVKVIKKKTGAPSSLGSGYLSTRCGGRAATGWFLPGPLTLTASFPGHDLALSPVAATGLRAWGVRGVCVP